MYRHSIYTVYVCIPTCIHMYMDVYNNIHVYMYIYLYTHCTHILYRTVKQVNVYSIENDSIFIKSTHLCNHSLHWEGFQRHMAKGINTGWGECSGH